MVLRSPLFFSTASLPSFEEQHLEVNANICLPGSHTFFESGQLPPNISRAARQSRLQQPLQCPRQRKNRRLQKEEAAA